MKIDDFWQYIMDIKAAAGNNQKKIIRTMIQDSDSDSWKASVSFIAGEEFGNVGVAPKTMMNAITESNLQYNREDISELKTTHGTVTEALLELYPFASGKEYSSGNMILDEFFEEDSDTEIPEYDVLPNLYRECQNLHSLSGNDLESKLSTMFDTYYPPAVSYCVLNDLSIGASKKTITMAVAENSYSRAQIERARAFTPNPVQFVELALEDNLQLEPTVCEPFDPMLAKSKDRPDDESDWIAQLKLDGHRLLLHISDNSATAFTRVRNNVSFSLPELDEIDWPNGEYVLDCEAVAYSESRGKLPFSKTSQRIGRKHNLDQFDYKIKFYTFDLLVEDGEDITTESQDYRTDRLSSLQIESDLVEVIDSYTSIDDAINTAKEEAYEGVIIKDLHSEYQFKRSSSWRKLKITEETVDLRVVEFERQQGADSDTLGNIGVETKDGVFVGYVGTGFSDDLKKEIWKNQDKYMGNIAEIQFEGFDEKLRFPSFKYFRDDGEPDTLDKVKRLASEV